ncbi:MAG: Coenzyme F420 hydrogenase/dehydrogenase, beta subunit C-terminal domain, partial [Candidatus Heimdallarchaeaceae archaeon]
LPKLVSSCISCGACFDVCYRYKLRKDGSPELSDLLDGIQEVYVGKSKLEEAYSIAQNGGVVTTLLINALRNGLIDAALVTDHTEDLLHPEPILATSENEILKASGSKYVTSGTLNKLDAIKTSHKKKVAIVGLPCHLSTLTNMMNKQYLGLDSRVKYKIRLFCMHSYSYEYLIKFLKEELSLSPSDIVKMDIAKGKFIFKTKDGEKKVKLSQLEFASAPGCHYCLDFTAENSDISVGNVGVNSKTNVIVVRNGKGKELILSAIKHGTIEAEKIDRDKWIEILDLANKLYEQKRKKAEPLPPLD